MKRIKKIGMVILSLMLIFNLSSATTVLSVNAASAPVLSAESKTVSAGDEFTVAIKLQNIVSVYNGNFTLQYDSSKLTVKSFAYGNIFKDHTKNCNLDYQSAGNLIRFTFSGAYSLSSEGTLVTFTFQAKDSVSGTAALQFNAYKMYDENGSSLSVTASGSNITITEKVSPVDPSATTVYADNTTAKPGNTISVPLYIKNNPGIAYAKFKVTYSDEFELISAINQNIFAGTYTTSKTIDVKPYVIQWMGADDSTDNGCFVILTFKISDDATEGDYKITITCEESYNSNFDDVTFSIVNPIITVNNCTPGDVNGDEKVNGKDAVLLAQYLAEWDVDINLDAADVNGDGKVNGKDGILLAQYLAEWDVILGK